MTARKTERPPVRSVLKDGLLHIPVGRQYVGYVVTLNTVEEKGDELILRLKILKKPSPISVGP